MEEEPEEEGMTGEEQSFDEEGHDGGISVDGMEGEIEEHEDLDEEMGDDGMCSFLSRFFFSIFDTDSSRTLRLRPHPPESP